jgi:spore germination protein KC
MNNYLKRLGFLLLAGILLSGCSGRVELNELLIVSSMGIDQDGDEVIVHLQVINAGGKASQQSTGTGGTVYTYTAQGKTLFDAIKNANNILPRNILFSHITSLIIGEEYAREVGLASFLDFLERNSQIRDSVLIFVAKDSTARDILTLYTPIFKNPGESIKERVSISSTSTGISEGIREKDIINWRYGEFRDPVIQGMERMELNDTAGTTETLEDIDANKKTYRMNGLALFQEERLTGWFDDNQTLAWSIIDNRVNHPVLVNGACEGQDGNLGFRVQEIKSSVKPKIKSGNISFDVNVTGTAVLKEVTCDLDVSDPKVLKNLEKVVENALQKNIESALDKAKNLEIDVFGFGKMVYDKEPDIWEKEYGKEWGTAIRELDVSTVVSIKMENTGTRVNTINEEE